MQERTSVPLTIFILLIVTAMIVVLGVQAKSVWVGLLILASLIAMLYALGTARGRQNTGFYIGVILGVAALVAAIWLSRLAGRFWWTPLLLFLSLMFAANGSALISEYRQPAGTLSVVIGVLFFLFGILGPWLLYGSLSGATAAVPTMIPTPLPEPMAIPADIPIERGNFFAGIWGFLLNSIKSGWGILYLALIILLGRIWFGKWGWLIAPIGLLLAAGVLAWSKPGGIEPLTTYFSTSPLDLLVSMLVGSARRFGSAAWGALFCGIGLVILLIPAYIVMYSANRAMVKAQEVRRVLGTTIAAGFLRRSGASTPYTSLVSILTVAASIAGFILIWKALATISASNGMLAFPLLGIADISLPRWKPIFQSPYLLNAGIYAVIGLILSAIQRRMGLAAVAVNWFMIIVGAFVVSIFAPAGVVFFLTGQSLALCVTAPLSLLKKTKLPTPPPRPTPQFDRDRVLEELQRRMAERERQRAAEEAARPTPPPARPPHEEIPVIVGGKYMQEDEEVDESKETEGKLLVEHDCEITDILTDGPGKYLLLDEFGGAWRFTGDGDENEMGSFDMDLPVGLARVSGERIAAVDQSGRVFFLGSPTDLVNTTAEVSSFTVNSFGTILAYISPGASTVRGYILAAGKDQLFIDCGIPLTDIRFSEDNRYLGIGTSEGKILVFDMASRQIAQTLTTPSLRGVRYLRPTPEGGWVAAYDNDKVALWESFGSLLNTTGTNGGVTCLAVDGKTGTVAYGDSLGEITILDKDFELLVTASLHEEDIVSVVFEPSGSSLVTAGRDGAVRRIEF